MYNLQNGIHFRFTLKYHANWPDAIDAIMTNPSNMGTYINGNPAQSFRAAEDVNIHSYVKPTSDDDGYVEVYIKPPHIGLWKLQLVHNEIAYPDGSIDDRNYLIIHTVMFNVQKHEYYKDVVVNYPDIHV